MIYGQFKRECQVGTQVKDGQRTGQVLKLSKDKEKALVKFSDGMTEWIEYYKIEMINS